MSGLRLCFIGNANSIHTRRWIQPFVEQGHTVHLLSYRTMSGTLPGVKTTDLTSIVNTRKLRFAYWGWWVRHYVHRLKPHILHAHQIQAAGWLGALTGYHPFVVSGWGSDILVEPHKSALRRLLVSIVLHQCDALTVPSRLLYNEAKSLGYPEVQMHLIPWGIDTSIFRPLPRDRIATRTQLGIDDDTKVLLCPRRISPLCNIDTVLKSIKFVSPSVPKLRLVLLRFSVDSSYMAELQRLIVEEGLSDIVTWLPSQESPNDMARLYRMADVTVSVPSSEGYGFTVFEAMAAGCPTIITDLPVFKDEIRNRVHALKVPVRDATNTGAAVETLLSNRGLRQHVVQNAIRLCRDKGVETRVAKSSALYQKLAGKPCAG